MRFLKAALLPLLAVTWAYHFSDGFGIFGAILLGLIIGFAHFMGFAEGGRYMLAKTHSLVHEVVSAAKSVVEKAERSLKEQ